MWDASVVTNALINRAAEMRANASAIYSGEALGGRVINDDDLRAVNTLHIMADEFEALAAAIVNG